MRTRLRVWARDVAVGLAVLGVAAALGLLFGGSSGASVVTYGASAAPTGVKGECNVVYFVGDVAYATFPGTRATVAKPARTTPATSFRNEVHQYPLATSVGETTAGSLALTVYGYVCTYLHSTTTPAHVVFGWTGPLLTRQTVCRTGDMYVPAYVGGWESVLCSSVVPGGSGSNWDTAPLGPASPSGSTAFVVQVVRPTNRTTSYTPQCEPSTALCRTQPALYSASVLSRWVPVCRYAGTPKYCKIETAIREPSLDDLFADEGGVYDGLYWPTDRWGAVPTGTKAGGFVAPFTLHCAASWARASRKVKFVDTWGPVQATSGVVATWVYGDSVFSTSGDVKYSVSGTGSNESAVNYYTYPATKTSSTPAGFLVESSVVVSGTGSVGSKYEQSCNLLVTLTPTGGAVGAYGTHGQTLPGSTSGGGGTATLCDASGGLLTRLGDIFTPVYDLECPLRYLFVPSSSSIGSVEAMVGISSSATAGDIRVTGAVPATEWLGQIGQVVATAPGELVGAIRTGSGTCPVPTVTVTSLHYTTCAGFTAAQTSSVDHGGWLGTLRSIDGVMFSLVCGLGVFFVLWRTLGR